MKIYSILKIDKETNVETVIAMLQDKPNQETIKSMAKNFDNQKYLIMYEESEILENSNE